MSASFSKIIELRQLIDKNLIPSNLNFEKNYPTGLPSLDEKAIPCGALTEIVSDVAHGPGGSLLLYALLNAALQKGERVVLIDGKNGFSPKGLSAPHLRGLLWLRCRDAAEAIKAADLVVRDGNVQLAVMLLALNPAGELRRIAPNAWHRLQILAEKSGAALLVFTPQAQIGCARLRLAVGGAFPLGRLHVLREELLGALDINVARRRVGRRMDEDLRRAFCA